MFASLSCILFASLFFRSDCILLLFPSHIFTQIQQAGWPQHKENNWLDHAISVKLSTESLLIRKHLSVKKFCYFLNGYFTTDLIDNMRLRRIWSRNHLIPGLLVPHFLSPRRNDPNKIDPPGPTVSIKFGPPGQMVPNQFGSHISGSLQSVLLDIQNILGTICPGGPNWLGTICPWGQNFWGPFVHGDRIGWGPFLQRGQLWGTKCPGTICVWDQICHSHTYWKKFALLCINLFETSKPKSTRKKVFLQTHKVQWKNYCGRPACSAARCSK